MGSGSPSVLGPFHSLSQEMGPQRFAGKCRGGCGGWGRGQRKGASMNSLSSLCGLFPVEGGHQRGQKAADIGVGCLR